MADSIQNFGKTSCSAVWANSRKLCGLARRHSVLLATASGRAPSYLGEHSSDAVWLLESLEVRIHGDLVKRSQAAAKRKIFGVKTQLLGIAERPDRTQPHPICSVQLVHCTCPCRFSWLEARDQWLNLTAKAGQNPPSITQMEALESLCPAAALQQSLALHHLAARTRRSGPGLCGDSLQEGMGHSDRRAGHPFFHTR